MSTVNYTSLQPFPRSIKERFAPKRLGSTYALVAFGTLVLCVSQLSDVYYITGTLILALIAEFIAVSVIGTLIVLMMVASHTSTRKAMRAFAADNGFTFTTPVPKDRSIVARSYSFNNKIFKEKGRITGGPLWRLDGMYNQTPFAIELDQTLNVSPMWRQEFPHYTTVLELPAHHQHPKLACCSHELASGMTVFKSPCILPSQTWQPFSFVKLVDAFYSSYFIDEVEAEIPFDTKSIETLLFDLAKEVPCDIEIGEGKLFIFFNGSFSFTRESFERIFHIIEASRTI